MAKAHRENLSTCDPLMSPSETARYLGVSERTLARWRETGDGPAYVRNGPRRVGYRRSTCDSHLDAHTFEHRADEVARATARLQPEAA